MVYVETGLTGLTVLTSKCYSDAATSIIKSESAMGIYVIVYVFQRAAMNGKFQKEETFENIHCLLRAEE